MPARNRCVVVADRTSARILVAGSIHGAARELVEHSELENCALRRTNIDQQFVAALARHVGGIVGRWDSGSVVIAAGPEMLGLLREVMQDALPKGVTLKALAKDYVSLSAPELAQRLNF
jgi:protein required for attachment to host cells